MKARFLVLSDYGMGGSWWWIRASSAERIVLTLAEVEVVTDADALRRAADDESITEFDLDDVSGDVLLDELRRQRDEQRDQPGFGALVGRERVYLRYRDGDDEDDPVYLLELGPDGRWIRQVEEKPDGSLWKASAGDWPINPPFDLYDPRYVPMEIPATEFETAWDAAERDPDYDHFTSD